MMELSEIKIPVPWGHVAAKAWGSSENKFVLCVHGWLDNASTFDNLIPLLPDNYYYVCIDLPGHGFSSPLAVSLMIHQVDYFVVLKLIMDYFNRKKYILLGHSMGAFISTLLTNVYPQYVSKLIAMDAYHFYPIAGSIYPEIQKTKIFQYEKMLKNKNIDRSFTYEEARDKLIFSRMTKISKDAAEILMRRAVRQTSDGKYEFTAMKQASFLQNMPYTVSFLLDMVKTHPIKCPHLLTTSSDSFHFKFCFKDMHKEYEKNKNFEFYEVEGTHDVHLEHPERIADTITTFLLKPVSKL